MSEYPANPVAVNHVEPVPRRVRAFLAGRSVVDTTDARYVWENTSYPQFYIPLADVDANVLVDEGTSMETSRGDPRRYGLGVGDVDRPNAATVLTAAESRRTERHRSLCIVAFDCLVRGGRADVRASAQPVRPGRRHALESSRARRVQGVVFAESDSPVLCSKPACRPVLRQSDGSGLRAPHAERYGDPCPYKGTTRGYWSAQIDRAFIPTSPGRTASRRAPLQPIAGLIAFYNEKVDLFLDGVELERPHTHLS